MRIHNPPVSAARLTVPLVGALLGMALVCQPSQATPFANYNIFISTGPTTADVVFVDGPHPVDIGLPSPADPPLPGWDANVIANVSVGPAAPPTLDETSLILTIPVNDTITHSARDTEENELGQLKLLAVGDQLLDLNAANAIVDEAAGTIQVRVGQTLLGGQPPTFSVLEATGIYASDVRVLDDGLVGYAGGHFLLPLDDDPGTSTQDNILNAWNAGQIVGADLRGVVVGTYVPEPSTFTLVLLGLLMGTFVYRPGSVRKIRIDE